MEYSDSQREALEPASPITFTIMLYLMLLFIQQTANLRMRTTEVIGRAMLSRKRKRDEYENKNSRFNSNRLSSKKRRSRVKFDRERAYQCIQQDWLGPYPSFDDDQFSRHFRVTRRHFQGFLEELPKNNSFFRQTYDAKGEAGIYTEVKLVAALKYLCYGTSYAAHIDYLQMHEVTVKECVRHFNKDIYTLYHSAYLRKMTKSDARRISRLHEKVHGVPGYLGNLDCMHILWKNCPIAWQGHFQGAKKRPTIVLEASSDYNLWFWHVACGFPGTMNDLNIWEVSKLHEQFLDRTLVNPLPRGG
jgi:hypothetical protein